MDNTLSGAVDVLPKLDWYVSVLGKIGSPEQAADLAQVRAAVAELIEATDCFTCAIAEDSSYRDDLLSAIRELERASFVEQLNRVRAALANTGGAK